MISKKKKNFFSSDIVRNLQKAGDAFNKKMIDAHNDLKKSQNNPANPVDKIDQFKRIAWGIIGDGINWGRIAVIFSLGALVVKDQGEAFGMSIFKFLMDFIKNKLLSWIVFSGGWVRIFFDGFYHKIAEQQSYVIATFTFRASL